MSAVIASLQQMQARAGGNAESPLNFLPNFSRAVTSEPMWMVPLANFFVFIGLQWWAFWYPGAEPGGGGYIAQRIFSARDEKQGLLSVLWFNIAHYAIRPWPWILTGVAVIVLYPGLAHPETGYMLVLNNYLPHQYRGIAIAGFLAAFMSTIATQLNWGASYLVSDFYRRFVNKRATENHYVMISRLCTVLLVIVAAWVSVQLGSIASGWEIVLQVGAGTGAVYILRWYWWRINAWSEISAMASSLAISLVLSRWHPFSGNSSLVFAKGALATTVVTSIVWITVTLLTKPEPQEVLTRFYRNVRPDVRGWKPVAKLLPAIPANRDLGANLGAWLLGCAMVYTCLFGTGKLLLHQPAAGLVLLVVSAICAFLLYHRVVRNFAVESQEPEGSVPDWVESPATTGH
jgi:Na+/proline symporter